MAMDAYIRRFFGKRAPESHCSPSPRRKPKSYLSERREIPALGFRKAMLRNTRQARARCAASPANRTGTVVATVRTGSARGTKQMAEIVGGPRDGT
jgi:hypothetical protein